MQCLVTVILAIKRNPPIAFRVVRHEQRETRNKRNIV